MERSRDNDDFDSEQSLDAEEAETILSSEEFEPLSKIRELWGSLSNLHANCETREREYSKLVTMLQIAMRTKDFEDYGETELDAINSVLSILAGQVSRDKLQEGIAILISAGLNPLELGSTKKMSKQSIFAADNLKGIKYLFISDTHLGSKSSRPDLLLKVLKKHRKDDIEKLYLVGDIVDGWKFSNHSFVWRDLETKVIREILRYHQKGTEIVYVIGNHDEFLRKYFDLCQIPGFKVTNEEEFVDDFGKKFLVIHGDQFDAFIKYSLKRKWLRYIGDTGYEWLIYLSRLYMRVFKNNFSFSKWVKTKFKDAMKFISEFEEELTAYAELNDCDGVICGHIHTPKIEEKYLNIGDFVENYSYIVSDGKTFSLQFAEKSGELVDISEDNTTIKEEEYGSNRENRGEVGKRCASPSRSEENS